MEEPRKPYAFRRETDGTVVWVDFQTMMNQRDGFIQLPDGVHARRCHALEKQARRKKAPKPASGAGPPAISDSLGFPEQCLESRRAQLLEFGCPGIEFKRDPLIPEFYQVHASSRRAMDVYTKKRGLVNMTGRLGGGVMFSQVELDRAAELIRRERI